MPILINLALTAANCPSSHDDSHLAMDTDLPHLEADFCKDFSCCGLVLDDLHDLLQHYEDHHVKLDDLAILSSTLVNPHASSARPNRPDLEAMKRKALLDMQRHLGQSNPLDEDEIAFDVYPGGDPFSRKRSWRPSMSSPSMATRDFFTPSQSPMSTPNSSSPGTPVMGVSHDFNAEIDNPLLFGPPSVSADWISSDGQSFRPMPQLKKARQSACFTSTTVGPQVIEHPASNLVVVDKPYKCQIPGCDKAYKNQNGLKYHKMHGNCASNPAALTGDGSHPTDLMPQYENKPYKCNLCNKRYKNLNGLKYHTAHSHQNVTTDSIQSQLAQQSQAQKIW
ncbi:hypothetical protein BCR37DRAFT_20149 [Protomyces lactucae-debilis]|uniref:C2H2-type domain-containing protein n=1 Tax=Protomyces lactucae-debilis TaxID=2754530 RepID=A0A1Y2FZD6_PROLT|nr:uncharacterized protein BCR37DRAFT_20149 [Protomyces lactucae-debilis]ORY87995.1 hypothetical protein BCR37DRAFT_20149 [Protomyces lactucae-debilis]